MPTKRDVKELAMWLHDAYLACPGTEGIEKWPKLPSKCRRFYLQVAEMMLSSPPMPILKAVRETENIAAG